jgi:hypothetical protein
MNYPGSRWGSLDNGSSRCKVCTYTGQHRENANIYASSEIRTCDSNVLAA